MNFCATAAFLGLTNLCQETKTINNEVEQAFIEHIGIHGKSYGTTEEYKFRLGVFADKHAEIEEINANPEHTFTVGHNFLSDMTKEEKKRMLGILLFSTYSNISSKILTFSPMYLPLIKPVWLSLITFGSTALILFAIALVAIL